MAVKKRTYSDRRSYIINAVRKRRKKVREMSVAYKGGKCEKCGYDHCIEALEFHHRDPSQKDFGLSEKGYTRSWVSVQRELDKCVLVCANCHRELHAKLAASAGNGRVTQRVNSGNPHVGNPEPSPHSFVSQIEAVGEGAETRHSPPNNAEIMASMVKV